MRSRSMRDNKTIQFKDLDQILQDAHLRRSADLGRWLRDYLKARQARPKDEARVLITTGTLHQRPI